MLQVFVAMVLFFSSGDSNKQLGDKAIGIGLCVWREYCFILSSAQIFHSSYLPEKVLLHAGREEIVKPCYTLSLP